MDIVRPLRAGQILLATVIVLPTMTVSSASAQLPPQTAPPGTVVESANGRQRIVVDGKTNPELVNHELLIAQILGLMAIPESPSAKDEQRLHVMAAAIGLGREDERILRTEMIRLYGVIAPIQDRLRNPPGGVPLGTPTADLQEFREARLQSYERLLELLSKDGRDKLNNFIEKQKANTKVIVPANQPR